MKRFLYFALILLLAACNNNEDSSESGTGNTPQSVAATEEVSPTPFRVSTLPPEATIAIEGATAAPTRTPPPSITPRPSATSNLMIPVTPPSATPSTTPVGPVFTITYEYFTERLNSIPPESGGDSLVPGSLRAGFADGTPFITFNIVSASTGQEREIRADLEFNITAEGVVEAGLVNVISVEDESPYNNEALTALDEIVQDALTTSLIANVEDEFSQGFSVLTFVPTEEGFVVETLAQ